MSAQLQICQACYVGYPADDPMMEVGDAGAFCSWECIAQFAADQEHCWTHQDLCDAYASFAARMAKITGREA